MLPRRQDKRNSVRLARRRAAQVYLGEDAQPVRCVICDISDGGARLAIARSLMNLLHRFTLSLSNDGSETRKCEVVWTDAASSVLSSCSGCDLPLSFSSTEA
jgi:c-di-GMP-binding flagellar brake protein YcgR